MEYIKIYKIFYQKIPIKIYLYIYYLAKKKLKFIYARMLCMSENNKYFLRLTSGYSPSSKTNIVKYSLSWIRICPDNGSSFLIRHVPEGILNPESWMNYARIHAWTSKAAYYLAYPLFLGFCRPHDHMLCFKIVGILAFVILEPNAARWRCEPTDRIYQGYLYLTGAYPQSISLYIHVQNLCICIPRMILSNVQSLPF